MSSNGTYLSSYPMTSLDRFMLSQLSSQIAQTLLSAKSNSAGDREQVSISVPRSEDKQRLEEIRPAASPPIEERVRITDASHLSASAQSDLSSLGANTTVDTGTVTALRGVSVAPESLEGAPTGGAVGGGPREGQMRNRAIGRRGRRKKVVLPVAEEVSNVR